MKKKYLLFILMFLIGGLALVACKPTEQDPTESGIPTVDEPTPTKDPTKEPTKEPTPTVYESLPWPDNDLVNVRFSVTIPEYTPGDDLIHIAGTLSHFGLSNWDPGAEDAILTKVGPNKYEIMLTLPEETTFPVSVMYKYTRGTWGHVEKGPIGEEISDRVLTIDGTEKQVVQEDKVMTWADLTEYIQGSTVVGDLEIVELTDSRFPNENARTRKVRIWTPEGYDPTDTVTKYPVIYMHDGQNVFDIITAFAGEWEADEAMVALMAEYESFKGAIIVGIDNSPQRMGEYVMDLEFLRAGTESSAKTGNYYMDFVVDVVKAYIDENYNTLDGRNNTYLAGSSLGGLISLFGGLEHLEVFGNILAFSSSTQLVTESGLPTYLASLDQTLLKDTKFYFYVGTAGDGNQNWPANYKQLLLDLDVDETHIKVEIGEGHTHNELAWRTHLPNALKFVFELE